MICGESFSIDHSDGWPNQNTPAFLLVFVTIVSRVLMRLTTGERIVVCDVSTRSIAVSGALLR